MSTTSPGTAATLIPVFGIESLFVLPSGWLRVRTPLTIADGTTVDVFTCRHTSGKAFVTDLGSVDQLLASRGVEYDQRRYLDMAEMFGLSRLPVLDRLNAAGPGILVDDAGLVGAVWSVASYSVAADAYVLGLTVGKVESCKLQP